MRKVLIAGVVVSALLVACETKSPSGPEGLTPTTSTTTSVTPTTTPTTTTSSTTTSVSIRSIAMAFGVVSPPPDIPSQMTLFARLLTGTSAPATAFSAPSGANTQSAPENEYEITGVYVMLNGTTGTVNGVLGGALDPLETGGVFIGRLTARTPSGCTAEREFSGTLSLLTLRWTGGAPGTSSCTPSPLAMASISMLRTSSDAPLPVPPSTTSSSSTTTTSVPCTYSLNPTSASVGGGSSTQSVAIVTQPGCGWSAQSFDGWLTVRPPQGGTGSATVFYDVAATSTSRVGRLRIAGIDFVVTQTVDFADLVPFLPPGAASYCRRDDEVGDLLVAVRNQGTANAVGSDTTVTFYVSGKPVPTTRPTPAIAAGANSPDVSFPIPSGCFNPNCVFDIRVNSNGAVTESNTTNNQALNNVCLG